MESEGREAEIQWTLREDEPSDERRLVALPRKLAVRPLREAAAAAGAALA